MTSKDDFVEAFEKKVGAHPETFKTNPAGFAAELNKDASLRRLFREAVAEATEDGNVAAGMGCLFP